MHKAQRKVKRRKEREENVGKSGEMRGHERNGENVTKIADITNECKHEYGKQ